MKPTIYAWVGRAVVNHYRRRQRLAGTYPVARQKQGFGLATAMMILARR